MKSFHPMGTSPKLASVCISRTSMIGTSLIINQAQLEYLTEPS